MAEICKTCKEPGYDPEEQVCKACGIVTEGIIFGAPNYSTYDPGSSYQPIRKKNPVPHGLKYGMDVLYSLSNKYHMSSTMREEVAEMLKKIHSRKSFHLKEDIIVMAGCCLIHVNKRYHRYIPISDLCKKLGCTNKSVYKCLKIIKLYSKENNESFSFGGSVLGEENKADTVVKSEFKSDLPFLKSSIRLAVSAAPDESRALLMEKTTALVKLAFSFWLGTGRSVEGLVAAATYLCWKSMDRSRRSLTFASFRKQFNLVDNKARVKISELTEMLLKLGEKIPSVTKDYVNKKNILLHLDYILKNSTTLRNDIHSGEFNSEEISKKEFSMFRKKRATPVKNENSVETVTYDPNKSDIEISDSEINSYIRTEEQVNVIKYLHDLNEPSEETSD